MKYIYEFKDLRQKNQEGDFVFGCHENGRKSGIPNFVFQF